MPDETNSLATLAQLDAQSLHTLAKCFASGQILAGRSPGDIMLQMAYGESLGLGPVAALQQTFIIAAGGVSRVSLSTAAALGLVRKSPLCAGVSFEETATSCSCTMKRTLPGGGLDEYTATWTLDDAKRAGLTGNQWQKYPKAMLRARATMDAARVMFPDVLMGISSEDELEPDTPKPGQPTRVSVEGPRPEPAPPAAPDVIDADFTTTPTEAGPGGAALLAEWNDIKDHPALPPDVKTLLGDLARRGQEGRRPSRMEPHRPTRSKRPPQRRDGRDPVRD